MLSLVPRSAFLDLASADDPSKSQYRYRALHPTVLTDAKATVVGLGGCRRLRLFHVYQDSLEHDGHDSSTSLAHHLQYDIFDYVMWYRHMHRHMHTHRQMIDPMWGGQTSSGARYLQASITLCAPRASR